MHKTTEMLVGSITEVSHLELNPIDTLQNNAPVEFGRYLCRGRVRSRDVRRRTMTSSLLLPVADDAAQTNFRFKSYTLTTAGARGTLITQA